MNSIIQSIGQEYGAGVAWLLTSSVVFMRYAIPASLIFLLVYKWKRSEWFARKIQQSFPKASQILNEISYSALTSLLFGGMAVGVFFLRKMGYGQLYFDVSEYGWGYLVFSFVFLIVAHDTYFYWMHRLMHHPKLYRRLHLVHHKSTNPTPYASFSFHPLESVLEFAIVPVLTLVLPIHATVFFLFTLWSIFFNILGHTGYEMMPKGFPNHPIFKWFNTSTHHNMHHRYARYNYGLYFNFWDRVMGTNHPEYEQYFEKVVERSNKATPKKPIQNTKQKANKAAIVIALLLCSVAVSGQMMSYDDIKNGNFGTPESRTAQMDEIMQKGLLLQRDQMKKVHEINLRYAIRTEEEVLKADLSNWSRYRRLMKIQSEKDKELEKVLTATQFEKYVIKRDEIFWKGVMDFFF